MYLLNGLWVISQRFFVFVLRPPLLLLPTWFHLPLGCRCPHSPLGDKEPYALFLLCCLKSHAHSLSSHYSQLSGLCWLPNQTWPTLWAGVESIPPKLHGCHKNGKRKEIRGSYKQEPATQIVPWVPSPHSGQKALGLGSTVTLAPILLCKALTQFCGTQQAKWQIKEATLNVHHSQSHIQNYP